MSLNLDQLADFPRVRPVELAHESSVEVPSKKPPFRKFPANKSQKTFPQKKIAKDRSPDRSYRSFQLHQPYRSRMVLTPRAVATGCRWRGQPSLSHLSAHCHEPCRLDEEFVGEEGTQNVDSWLRGLACTNWEIPRPCQEKAVRQRSKKRLHDQPFSNQQPWTW